MRIRLAILLLLPASAATAASVDLGAPEIRETEVRIPIRLSGDTGEGVAALNFDVSYDPGVLEPVSALEGPAAAAADKRIQAHEAGRGQYRVVMFDVNMNAVQGGEIATVVFKRTSRPASGSTGVRVLRTTMATAEGAEISSRGSSRLLEFPSNEGEGDNEDNGEDGEESPGEDEQEPGPGDDAEAPNGETGETDEVGGDAASPLDRLMGAPGGDGPDAAEPPAGRPMPPPATEAEGGAAPRPSAGPETGDLTELAEAIGRAEGARGELPAVPSGGDAQAAPPATSGAPPAGGAAATLAQADESASAPAAPQAGVEGSAPEEAARSEGPAESADPGDEKRAEEGGKIPAAAVVIAAVVLVLGLLAVRRLLFG